MNKYKIEHIGHILKKARKELGMSQRELSIKSHVPQSHISKIESGKVDLQISSLIDLARILEMEPMLIPRSLIHTVSALLRPRSPNDEPRPKYSIEKDDDEEEE